MVEVRAFRPLEFDARKVELAKVVAPPFDVINEEAAEALRAKSPFNFVHATLPIASKKDPDAYAHADKVLQEWEAAGILRSFPDEAVYAYEIWHQIRRQERRMRGILVAIRLDPTYKTVVPHEKIFEKPTEDRLKLLRATAIDLEPIQLLYSGKTVEETLWAYIDGGGSTPDLLVTAPDGAIHKLWRVVDPAVVGTIVEGLKGRKAYIADGHHRYATAVKYAEERRSMEYRPSKKAEYEFKLVLLTNMNDAGLAILPTHRVLKRPKRIDMDALRRRLEADYSLERHTGHAASLADDIVAALERDAASAPHVFALYAGEGAEYWIARSRQPVLSEADAPGKSFTWRSLSVAFLHHQILVKHLDLAEDKWGDDVTYTRDENEAVKLVQSKKAGLAIFHLPTRLIQLRAIADGGEVMPPKSTYFVPKTLSGLVLRPIGKQVPVDPTRRRFTS